MTTFPSSPPQGLGHEAPEPGVTLVTSKGLGPNPASGQLEPQDDVKPDLNLITNILSLPLVR